MAKQRSKIGDIFVLPEIKCRAILEPSFAANQRRNDGAKRVKGNKKTTRRSKPRRPPRSE